MIPSTNNQRSATSEGNRVVFSACLLLVVLCFAVYYPVGRYPFINYDDPAYVTKNPHVSAGLTLQGIRWAFTATHAMGAATWHPLTWISHMMDVQWFGMRPAGHHCMNLLLHAANGVLIFLLLQLGTGKLWRSFLVAAIFVVHPVNVESVAWIAERKNLLSTLFWLLTIGAYGWYAAKPGWRPYPWVVLFFILGLMSKPMVVTLPFALLLLDYWPLRRFGNVGQSEPGISRPFAWLVLEKAPLLLLALAGSLITLYSQRVAGAMNPGAAFPLSERLANAVVSYGKYLSNFFWPAKLAILYPHPARFVGIGPVLFSMAALLAISSAIFFRPGHRALLVGWLWFLGTLVPVIGLVQVGSQAMADRYAYIPYMGLLVMAVWAAADRALARSLPRSASFVAALLMILILGALTRHQLRFWQDDFALWSHTDQVTHNNYEARIMLGNLFDEAGKSEAAVAEYYSALNTGDMDPMHYYNVGTMLQKHEQFAVAIRCYETAIARTDYFDIASNSYNNMGMAQLHLGETEQARESFLWSLQIYPKQASAYVGLARLSLQERKYDEAIVLLKKSLEIAPSDWAFVRLGDAYAGQGKWQASIQAFQEALKLSPAMPEAQHGLELAKGNLQVR